MGSKPTRLSTDLVETAKIAGGAMGRSTSQQIEYWARFGMYLEGHARSLGYDVERLLGANTPLSPTDEKSHVTVNASISASISTAANRTSFARRLALRGVATVVMDDDGRMVRRDPDGTTTVL